MRRYCTYQERCYKEVKAKLTTWGFSAADIDRIASQLIEENFLNEERFVKAIAGGKFRTKAWGPIKIQQKLAEKGISSTFLQKMGKNEVPKEDFKHKLAELLLKKLPTVKETNPQMLQQKLFKYAQSKGYETDMILESLKQILK